MEALLISADDIYFCSTWGNCLCICEVMSGTYIYKLAAPLCFVKVGQLHQFYVCLGQEYYIAYLLRQSTRQPGRRGNEGAVRKAGTYSSGVHSAQTASVFEQLGLYPRLHQQVLGMCTKHWLVGQCHGAADSALKCGAHLGHYSIANLDRL